MLTVLPALSTLTDVLAAPAPGLASTAQPSVPVSAGQFGLGAAVLGYLCWKTEWRVRRRRRGIVQAAFEEIAEVPAGRSARQTAAALLHVLAGAVLVWQGHELPGPALAALGLAAGLAGWPGAVCGAVLAGLLLDSGRTPLVWAALPMLAGYGIRLAHLLPERWRSPDAALTRISRYGPFIRPPQPIDRFWNGAMLLTAAAPMLVVGSQGGSGLVPVLCAAALVSQLMMLDRAVRQEHRWGVRSHRFLMTAGNLVAVLMAAGPVGGWFASRWSGTALLTGWLGGLLICGTVLAVRLVWPGRLRALTAHWLFPFWAVVVFHPAQGTQGAAEALAPLLMAETVIVCLVDRPAPGRIVDRLAAFMIQQTTEYRLNNFLGPWLYDGFLSVPGTADFRLVRRYLGMAVHAARGGFVPGQSTVVNMVVQKDPALRKPLTGDAALRWTALATEALALVDEEVAPRVPAEAKEGLAAARSVVEAELVLTKALVLTFAGEWGDALRGWREAAFRYKALGLPAEESVCRAGAGHVLESGLGRAEDAARERARIRPDLPEPGWDLLDDRVRDGLRALAGLGALSAHRDHQADRPRVESA
ncbi:hypothetical protein [Streptomyces sp. NPDC127084]|uniref:hypothetical protein n=1 Tax=Streptomyces sp. NPDC127084 TaxID=3347133 RepID=UPI003654CAA0